MVTSKIKVKSYDYPAEFNILGKARSRTTEKVQAKITSENLPGATCISPSPPFYILQGVTGGWGQGLSSQGKRTLVITILAAVCCQ